MNHGNDISTLLSHIIKQFSVAFIKLDFRTAIVRLFEFPTSSYQKSVAGASDSVLNIFSTTLICEQFYMDLVRHYIYWPQVELEHNTYRVNCR